MAKRSAAGETAREYVLKFPNTSTRALARMIMRNKKDSKLFLSEKAADRMLRYYKGSSGKKDRKAAEKSSPLTTSTPPGEGFEALPEPWESLHDAKPFMLTGDNSILALYDVHIPYHDLQGLKTALDYGKRKDSNVILLAGDYLDCYNLSSYSKDPRVRDFPAEREAALQSFDALRQIFPDERIIYKIGNHEDRWERYLKVKAPELFELEYMGFQEFYKLEDYDIEYVPSMQFIDANGLAILHGHEMGGFTSSVNVARGLFLKTQRSAICGHHHQSSQYTGRPLGKQPVGCWSVGTLGHLHPEYKPHNRWNAGFAHITTEGTKKFSVKNLQLIKGEIVGV